MQIVHVIAVILILLQLVTTLMQGDRALLWAMAQIVIMDLYLLNL